MFSLCMSWTVWMERLMDFMGPSSRVKSTTHKVDQRSLLSHREMIQFLTRLPADHLGILARNHPCTKAAKLPPCANCSEHMRCTRAP